MTVKADPALERYLDEHDCQGDYIGRVAGGDPYHGEGESRYVCEGCKPTVVHALSREYNDVRFIPKGEPDPGPNPDRGNQESLF